MSVQDENAPGTDLELTAEGIAALREKKVPAPVIELMLELDGLATPDDGLNYAALSIMGNILEAVTLEDIFTAADAATTSGDDFTDAPFRLRSDVIDWRRAARQYVFDKRGDVVGFPFYAMFPVTTIPQKKDELSREVTLSCGGYSFLAVLFSLWKRGYLKEHDETGGMPLVIKSKPVASGYTVLLLQPWDIPF